MNNDHLNKYTWVLRVTVHLAEAKIARAMEGTIVGTGIKIVIPHIICVRFERKEERNK